MVLPNNTHRSASSLREYLRWISEPGCREEAFEGPAFLRFTLRRVFLSAFRRIELLHERIGLRGGTLKIKSAPGEGAYVVAEVPKQGTLQKGKGTREWP